MKQQFTIARALTAPLRLTAALAVNGGLALTAMLAVTVVLASPVASFAQTQPSPLPSADPSSGPSVTMPANASSEPSSAPSAESSPAPVAEPSAQASPAHKSSLAKRAVHGVLKSLKGTKAIVKLADGTTQTFNVSAQTAALLKNHLGKNGVYRVVDGVLTLVPAATPLSP